MNCRMKCRIFVAIILIAGAAVLGRQMSRRHHPSGGVPAVNTREETRQTYPLEPGAAVEVSGINGSVEVNTSETNTAQVSIVRTGGSDEDAAASRVVVEHEPSRLVVRGENNASDGLWGKLAGRGGNDVRYQVVLSLPRRVELETTGVNGPVKIGEVDGSVMVNGVNGRVEVAQSAGRSEVKGVNGAVKVAVARLGAGGMNVNGVNGRVEIELKERLDADIEVRGLNGGLTLDVPNVTMQEREDRSNMRARLGAGGAPVEIVGVNGSVRFSSNAAAASAAHPATAPVAPVIVEVPSAPRPPAHPADEDHR